MRQNMSGETLFSGHSEVKPEESAFVAHKKADASRSLPSSMVKGSA